MTSAVVFTHAAMFRNLSGCLSRSFTRGPAVPVQTGQGTVQLLSKSVQFPAVRPKSIGTYDILSQIKIRCHRSLVIEVLRREIGGRDFLGFSSLFSFTGMKMQKMFRNVSRMGTVKGSIHVSMDAQKLFPLYFCTLC